MPDEAMIWLKFETMRLRIWNSISLGGEVAVGADDLDQELARVGDPHGVGAEGAQPHHAELGVAAGDRVAGAPLQVGEAAGVDEVDLRLERRLEAVVPVLERGQDRHVVGLELVEPGAEDVGELALVDEDRGLPLAHGQLGAVLDRVALALEAPDDGVAGVVRPVDDVDELAAQEIQDRHRFLLRQLVGHLHPPALLGAAGRPGRRGRWRAGAGAPRRRSCRAGGAGRRACGAGSRRARSGARTRGCR